MGERGLSDCCCTQPCVAASWRGIKETFVMLLLVGVGGINCSRCCFCFLASLSLSLSLSLSFCTCGPSTFRKKRRKKTHLLIYDSGRAGGDCCCCIVAVAAAALVLSLSLSLSLSLIFPLSSVQYTDDKSCCPGISHFRRCESETSSLSASSSYSYMMS